MIKRLLGLGLVAAFLAISGPALAATHVAAPVASDPDVKSELNDCLASFDAGPALLLVEVVAGCDPLLAETTGLCLVPADPAIGFEGVVGVLDPEQGVTCTTGHPRPPG